MYAYMPLICKAKNVKRDELLIILQRYSKMAWTDLLVPIEKIMNNRIMGYFKLTLFLNITHDFNLVIRHSVYLPGEN